MMQASAVVTEFNGTALLRVYLQPGASRAQCAGLFGEPARLKVKVTAPPVDGAANAALIEFLSDQVKVPKSHFEIVRGHTSRMKDVVCRSLSASELVARLDLAFRGE